MSGLKVNNGKTKVWFSLNTPRALRKTFVDRLGFNLVSKLSKYLGTHINSSKDKSVIARELVEKICKNFKAGNLNFFFKKEG